MFWARTVGDVSDLDYGMALEDIDEHCRRLKARSIKHQHRVATGGSKHVEKMVRPVLVEGRLGAGARQALQSEPLHVLAR
jgi:hypothetical protein